MKVIHALKKIEQIDDDVRELRKMEKSLQRNKSFTTPIFMTIEKQINNLLGDKNKILELTLSNPPEAMAREFDGDPAETVRPLRKSAKADKAKKAAPKQKETAVKPKAKTPAPEPVKTASENEESFESMDSIPMLTQDMIDSKFDTMKASASREKTAKEPLKPLISRDDDRDVKLLDIALTKGTLNKEEIEKEKDKTKRVRFFRDNFPGSDY